MNNMILSKRLSIYAMCICICTVLIFSLSSCGKKEAYKGYYVYGLDANEKKVMYEKCNISSEDKTAKSIKKFIRKLQREPDNINMKKAIPDDVKVDNFNISPAGQPITDSNMKPVGIMTADSFIDNTGGVSDYKQKATLNMYFSDETGKSLVIVPVNITYDATIPLEQLAIEQLISGPYTIDGVNKNKVLPTVPKGTVLNKVTVKEKTCYVDFSKEFLNKQDDITDMVAIYSVVNTLIELPNVNKVQFSIDGEQVLKYNESMSFGEPFERNLDIVKEKK